MKFNRFLNVVLLGLGCMCLFVGLLATILPGIENAQLQLVLASFDMPTENIIVRAINLAMNAAMDHSLLIIGIGGGLTFFSIIFLLIARPKPSPITRQAMYQRPTARTPADAPFKKDITTWQPIKAPAPEERNPFADTSISTLLMPKSTAYSSPLHTFSSQSYEHSTDIDQDFDELTAMPYSKLVAADPVPEWITPQRIVQPASPPPRHEAPTLDTSPIPVILRDQAPIIEPSVSAPEAPPPAPPEVKAAPANITPQKSVQIRSTFKSEQQKKSEPDPAPADPPLSPAAPPSSRIKSTMGRHH